jgi:Big-like domain-containing protein
MNTHGRIPAVILIFALSLIGVFAAPAQPALADTRSQNIALVPSAQGRINMGGTLPTSIVGRQGVPAGYSPAFTMVLPETIATGGAGVLSGFDTVALVGICDIGDFLSGAHGPNFKTNIESFVSNGGKLIIWDPECTSTNYSNFVYPFTTSNPGAAGATGTLTDVEENSLSSSVPANDAFVNVVAVSTGTDAVGDANVFVSFNQNWCTDLRATNTLGVNGPVQTYARLGSGLIIYSGLDKDAMSNVTPSFDKASLSGAVHLQRIWLLELLQPFNPDNLPCGVKVFGISLTPKTDINDTGTSHTVTAHVSTNASPTPNVTVTFTVTLGPNAGQTGTSVTNASGDATFTYTSNGTAGTDTIEASATLTGSGGQPQTVTDTATKTWRSVIGPPAVLTLTPPADTNTVGSEHCVTATVADATAHPTPGITVIFSVTGTNPQSNTSATTDANGQATFCYTGTQAGPDTIKAFADTNTNGSQDTGEPSGTAAKAWLPGAPATLTLTPSADTNTVGAQHCVTATVRDNFGNPVPNVSVRFSVGPSVPATFPSPSTGQGSTNSSGQAAFCYTVSLPGIDRIHAFADLNGDQTEQPTEPSDDATKTWTLPGSGQACDVKVTLGGWIIANDGDRANFGGNAQVLPNGSLHGQQEYQDHGPTLPMNVHSIEITAMTCNTAQTAVSIFGTASIDGSGSHGFRIDVTNNSKSGGTDTYGISLDTGYTSGQHALNGGQITIH